MMLKKTQLSIFIQLLAFKYPPPQSFVNIFCDIFQMVGGSSICCFTKVEIWSCRKSALFSEEQQSLPQPFALAEILKQPMRGKQRQNSYRFVDPRCRYFLFLFWNTLRKRSVLGTRANAFSHVSLSKWDPSRVAWTPSSLSENPFGETKTNSIENWLSILLEWVGLVPPFHPKQALDSVLLASEKNHLIVESQAVTKEFR